MNFPPPRGDEFTQFAGEAVGGGGRAARLRAGTGRVMPTSEVDCDVSAARVWELIATPGRWREWSPHVVGAEGLGAATVKAGAEGHVVLRGGLRLPARISTVEPGRSWTWQVGGIHVLHGVGPRVGGSRIRLEVTGSSRPWSAAALAYLPAVALIARNIARVAERQAQLDHTSDD